MRNRSLEEKGRRKERKGCEIYDKGVGMKESERRGRTREKIKRLEKSVLLRKKGKHRIMWK